MCLGAEGLWMGILLLLFNALGLVALWRGQRVHSKCLFVSYFACSVVGCIGMAELFIASIVYSIFIAGSYDWQHQYE